MATDFGLFCDILSFCQKSIEKDAKKALKFTADMSVSILKRNKHLEIGDFVGIIHELKAKYAKQSQLRLISESTCEVAVSHRDSQDELKLNDVVSSQCVGAIPTINQMMDLLRNYPFEALLPFKATAVQVTPQYDVYFKLDRKEIYSRTITEVLNTVNKYGHCSFFKTNGASSRKTLKACINVTCLAENTDFPELSVCHFRSLLLSEHVAALLKANGFDVTYMKYPICDKWKDCMANVGISCEWYHTTSAPSRESSIGALRDELQKQLHNSRHLESVSLDGCNAAISDDTHCGDLSVKTESNPCIPLTVINLRKFLVENQLEEFFDKNINLGDFSEDSIKLHYLTALEYHRRNTQQVYDHIVHIVPQERSFYQQTVDIGWRIINEQNKNTPKQVHVVHGTVTSRGGQLPVFKSEDFLSLRMNEMRIASVVKYGSMGESPEWEATVHALTMAGIKFEILSTTCRLPVKLDLSEMDGSKSAMDSRGGIFVMYNCARLSNLFSNFDKAVHKGIYPALPEIETLDFSLLREEDEWCLMFNYVLCYPSMVQDCVAAAMEGTAKTLIHTHKVSQFLQDLSKDLSSYYCRVHVLGEPREHLFPLMYCRIYLLKAIQRVMHNALSLLSIQPLTQL